MAVVVDVERRMDLDDEMKNIGMRNRKLMEDDQDLLEMVDNRFFIFQKNYCWIEIRYSTNLPS